MTPVTALALEVIYHRAEKENIERFVKPLNAAMERFDIVTPERQAAFLAQLGHESAGLSRLEEGLNYSSAERIALIFKSRIDTNHDGVISPAELDFARMFVHQPTAFANYIYANRLGNGSESSGDGYKYRGRGPIQITGKSNYARCSISLFNDQSVLLGNPDLLLVPDNGAMSSAWFWWANGLNELADDGDFRQITKRLNGAYTNYKERTDLWSTAKQILV